MFETPYQTTPGARTVLDRTATGIRRLEINDELVSMPNQPGNILLVPPGVVEFPPFQQPITRREIPTLEAGVVLDGRSMLRPDRTPVNPQDVYNHQMRYAKLTALWYEGGVAARRDILTLGEFPIRAFVSWISQALALRLGLDFGQTSIVRALVAVYYIQLHEPAHAHGADNDKLLIRAARALPGMDPETLGNMLGEIPQLNNIQDFVTWTKKMLDSPRAEDLTVNLVWASLYFSFGVNFREQVAVATEYPPAFIGLVYSALIERSYSKTGLGKTIERVITRQNDKEFIKGVNQLLAPR